jgi:hypothetical protein
MKAALTLNEIVQAGVNVVDLSDSRVYNAETLEGKDGGMSFLIMVVHFIRANQESVVKSQRVHAAYSNKRKKVSLSLTDPGTPKHLFTRMLPAWLTVNEEAKQTGGTSAPQIEVIEERAEIVRWIFDQAKDGHGYNWIAKTLNDRKVPTWGMLGKRQAAYWAYSYISKILWNRAVLGDFVPHLLETENGKKRRKPLDPVPGYFPAIVDASVWDAVHRRLATLQPKGRHAGKGPKHVLAGLLRCSHCGGSITRIVRPGLKKTVAVGKYSAAGVPGIPTLICARANSKGGCKRLPVPCEVVEAVVVRNIRGIIREAPAGLNDKELDDKIRSCTAAVDAFTMEQQEALDVLTDPSLTPTERRAARTELAAVEDKLGKAKDVLQGLVERRETLTAPW